VGPAGRWMVAALVTAAAFAVFTWVSGVFLFTRLLPSPDVRWPVAFGVGAAAAAFAGLWGQSWATGNGNADRVAGLTLAGIADGLAGRLRSQWEREAQVRRLNEPYPLPLSWTAADAPLAGDLAALKTLAVSGAGWSVPVRDDWAQRPEDLAGKGRELVEVLARVPTGRLVVLGEPGVGKTMLMVRLMLDLLARRADGGPVPVLAPAASWNPEKRDLHGWLADMLVTGYPDMALPPPGSTVGNRFEALVAAGLILPVLDGLDEISESAKAIKRINEELRPGEQVVVTCRTEQYRAAVRPQGGQGVALRAAAVQLSTLEFDEVASYLRKDADPAEGRWDFLDTLSAGSPVRQALTTPLMAGLARAIYNPRPGELAGTLPDPAELCNPVLRDRRAVESRLFDAFIPAAYRHDPDGRWKAQDAEKWLVFLARHLEREIAGPDLAWWQLRRSMPRTAFGAVVLVAAVAGVVTGVVVGHGLAAQVVAGGVLAVGLEVVIGIGAAIGVAVPLVAGLVGRSSSKAPARGVRIRDGVGVLAALLVGRRRAEAPVFGVGVRPAFLWGLLVAGVVIVAESVARAGSAAQAVLNVAFVVALVVVVASGAGLEGVPGDLEEAASPRAVLARDRRAALLLMLAAGVAAGYLVGAMAGAGATAGIAAAAGAGVGIGLSARQTAWPSYLLTMGWLALGHRLPRSLMGFLADAHQRGVLRQAGAVYQFRHIELQHRLATRP
jgi:hypothetical protein